MIIATAGGFFRHLDAGKWADIGQATLDTLLMLLGSLPLTLAIGLPLGVLLYLFGAPQMKRRPFAYGVLALVVNLLRSVPFIILMIVLIPVTLFLMGTSLGVRGAIVPLVIGAAPFYARLVETALREVDRGVIEATQAMGATTSQVQRQFFLEGFLLTMFSGGVVFVLAMAVLVLVQELAVPLWAVGALGGVVTLGAAICWVAVPSCPLRRLTAARSA